MQVWHLSHQNVKSDTQDRGFSCRSHRNLGKNMSNTEPDDFVNLDDPSFLAERARIRELLEDQLGNGTGHVELRQRYDAMTEEFCRRARIAWTRTS
jgi:hypothetical protein